MEPKLTQTQKYHLEQIRQYGPKMWVSRRNTPGILKSYQALERKGLVTVNETESNALMVCYEVKHA